ncbi:MAG: hypothetical protein R3B47_03360 [Bacteroidia bacterium]
MHAARQSLQMEIGLFGCNQPWLYCHLRYVTETVQGDSIDVVIKITPGYVDTMNNYFCDTDSLRNELGVFWPTVECSCYPECRIQAGNFPNI